MLAFSGNTGIDQNSSNNVNQIQGQMRLREEPSTINPSRNNRKRKSPPNNPAELPPPPPPPPPPQPQQMLHHLPPPHAMIHPMQPGALPPHYPYADYTPGGMPPQDPSQQSPTSTASGRALSSSKRAEQNRKAQRAFRERRDQHVKALESRSQLLDAALASADEANRRWEECRTLVDQLRVENAALRAALSQASLLPPALAVPATAPPPANSSSNAPAPNGAHDEAPNNSEPNSELKTDSAEVSSAQKNE